VNLSGIVEIPGDVQLSFISAHGTRGPVRPSISGSIDLEGDGANGQPLPGLDYKKRGLGKSELEQLVSAFNTQYPNQAAATPCSAAAPFRPCTVRNQVIPTLTLPASFSFGDNFHSQDIRVTKIFRFRERYKLNVFVEAFNVFNIANLGGYSFDLRNTAAFGVPTSRAGQVFGTGGPRAFQFGSRFSF
ncbi:MAG: hypothetical protein ACRD44_12130, partial [Bryobacteraceae bacterium]